MAKQAALQDMQTTYNDYSYVPLSRIFSTLVKSPKTGTKKKKKKRLNQHRTLSTMANMTVVQWFGWSLLFHKHSALDAA